MTIKAEMVNYPTPTPHDGQTQAATCWMAFGISETWISHYLEPICWNWEDQFQRRSSPEHFQALLAEKVDWDVLFLGSDLHEPMRAETLEAGIEALCRRHPIKCVVAVTPTTSYRRQLTLMQLGAVEVLTLDAAPSAIERAVDHVITLARARQSQIDHDKLKLLNHLAVSVNHEINNPLTGLMGTAELLLLEGLKLDEKVRRDLKTIIGQCRRIQEVTTQLKNLNHLRTVPYGKHDEMIDLIRQVPAEAAPEESAAVENLIFPAPIVLVVDDNPLITDLIARLFEQRFRIDSATCASEALARLDKSTYDLILIDLILPEMNGLELYRAIRRRLPTQKALLMTAYQGDVRVEQAKAEGALGCVYKPFQLEELEAALVEALRGK